MQFNDYYQLSNYIHLCIKCISILKMRLSFMMMAKLLIVIFLLCVLKYCSSEDESAVQFEEEAETDSPKKVYDTKFDNVDIEDLLKNDRLLKNYVKCLEYEGPCTPDGKMLRGELVFLVEKLTKTF